MSLARFSFGQLMRGALFALATAAAQPAFAQTVTTAYYRDPALTGYSWPGPDHATLTIPVTASVGGSCGFVPGNEPNANFNVGAIDTTGWSRDVPFKVECTAPWRIAVKSQNGGLKTGAVVQSGYIDKATYNVALNLPWDTGTASGTVADNCAVELIDQAAGSTACTFEGTASNSNGLLVPRSVGLAGSKITLTGVANPGPAVLVAGTYTDTLVVTISPAS
ncbi:MAG: hypothetical protein ACKOPE_11500 [Novosphingobium sp.]